MNVPMSTLDDHRARIARVIEHLERDLDAAFDVPSLARIACISEFHFHRVFRAIQGEPVMGHVRRLRLERAARQLRSTDEKVVSVALGAGFDAHEAFTRAFAAHFGVSPSDYRKARFPAPRCGEVASPPPGFAQLETRPASTLLCAPSRRLLRSSKPPSTGCSAIGDHPSPAGACE